LVEVKSIMGPNPDPANLGILCHFSDITASLRSADSELKSLQDYLVQIEDGVRHTELYLSEA
jgi:hypothetical protein